MTHDHQGLVPDDSVVVYFKPIAFRFLFMFVLQLVTCLRFSWLVQCGRFPNRLPHDCYCRRHCL